jgi:hypothetical protein
VIPGRLAEVLADAVDGRFPAADGGVAVVPPWQDGVEAVISFTGHVLIATTLPLAALLDAGADAFGGATLPTLLTRMAGEDGEVECLDVLLGARGTGGGHLPRAPQLDGHPRAVHARHWRTNVRAYGDDRGLLVVAAGVAGLPQLSYEVPPGDRNRGNGRALLSAGLSLIPEGSPVLTAAAPGNAASLRAILATGFTPLGSVQLVHPGRRRQR